jgi:hypothetical protein
MHQIPKQVYIAWNDKTILSNQSPLIQNGIKNLVDLNPEWSVTIYDDEDIDLYLQQCLDSNDYKLIQHKHIVEKSDIWRLFKMYNEGGMYVDIDRYCNVKLDSLLDDDTKLVLPTCLDNDFSQDLMISAAQNPIYLRTIELILTRRKQGHTNTFFLGPQTYMHAVTEVLCGEIINTDPGLEKFAMLRQLIQQIPFVKTYKEYPPYDTIIYKHDAAEFKTVDGLIKPWNLYKKDLYVSSGIGHWSWTKEQLEYELHEATQNTTTI